MKLRYIYILIAILVNKGVDVIMATKNLETNKKANLPFIFFILSLLIYCIGFVMRYTGFESEAMVVLIIAIASSIIFGLFSIVYTALVKENKYFIWGVLTIILPMILGFMSNIFYS